MMPASTIPLVVGYSRRCGTSQAPPLRQIPLPGGPGGHSIALTSAAERPIIPVLPWATIFRLTFSIHFAVLLLGITAPRSLGAFFCALLPAVGSYSPPLQISLKTATDWQYSA